MGTTPVTAAALDICANSSIMPQIPGRCRLESLPSGSANFRVSAPAVVFRKHIDDPFREARLFGDSAAGRGKPARVATQTLSCAREIAWPTGSVVNALRNHADVRHRRSAVKFRSLTCPLVPSALSHPSNLPCSLLFATKT